MPLDLQSGHRNWRFFVMAGRLFQGQWNLALFEAATGKNLHALDIHHRVTDVQFIDGGARLLVAKAKQQEKRKEGVWPPYGAVEVYTFQA